MRPPLNTLRISTTGREQLILLKRYTQIETWNVLCRWALCTSLADPTPPSRAPLDAPSNIELSWAVFAGALAEPLNLLIRDRARRDGLDPADERALAEELTRHVHRGLAALASRGAGVRSIEALLGRVLGHPAAAEEAEATAATAAAAARDGEPPHEG